MIVKKEKAEIERSCSQPEMHCIACIDSRQIVSGKMLFLVMGAIYKPIRTIVETIVFVAILEKNLILRAPCLHSSTQPQSRFGVVFVPVVLVAYRLLKER